MKLNNSSLRNHFQNNVTIYLFMISLFVTGVVFGAIIVNSMSFIQKQDLYFHLNEFYQQLIDGEKIISTDLLRKSFYFHLQYLFILFILGLTIIGIPLIWLLLFLKGLVVGFSVGFIVNQLGWKGLVLSILSIAPQNILIIPIYIVAASGAMLFSVLLFRKITAKTPTTSISPPFIQYILLFALLFLFALIGSIIETFVSFEVVKFSVKRYF